MNTHDQYEHNKLLRQSKIKQIVKKSYFVLHNLI